MKREIITVIISLFYLFLGLIINFLVYPIQYPNI